MLKILKTINIALVTALFSVTWCYYYTWQLENPFLWKGNVVMTLLFFGIYCFFAQTYDGFKIQYNRITESIAAQSMSLVLSDGLMAVVIFLLSRAHFASVVPFLLMFVVQLLVIALWCYIVHRWYMRKNPPKSSIVIYENRKDIANLINDYGMENRFNIEKVNSIDEIMNSIDVLCDYEVIFLNDIKSHNRNKIIKYCIAHNITAYVLPSIGDTLVMGSESVHMFNLPILKVERFSPNWVYKFIKRVFDIVSASLLFVVISPLLLITTIAIKASDGGPVFYKQTRLTTNGKEFKMLKFRSMIVDAESDGVARLSSGEDDDRITPVGRFMRKHRIDELPQLINIIKGDMSVVGPRPERPEIAKEIEKDIPEFKFRLQVKAGLTGYAQVYGKYSTTPQDKLLLDLMYINHANIILDLQIIFATLLTIFQKRSTE